NCQKKRITKRNQAFRLMVAAAPAHPIKVGMAPGRAPNSVHSGVLRFSGVYTKRYDNNVEMARNADSRFTATARYSPPAMLSSVPNQNASRALSLPDGSGREAVRRIWPSQTRSSH